VNALMAIYDGAQTVVRTGDSKTFDVKVGLYQGSVLTASAYSPENFVYVDNAIAFSALQTAVSDQNCAYRSRYFMVDGRVGLN